MTPDPQTPDTPLEPDAQRGGSRSPAHDDELKRLVKQHPTRDQPRVDGPEPGEPRRAAKG